MLLNKEQIREIMVGKLGIKDIDSWNKWLEQYLTYDLTKRKMVTLEDVELLSPDNINNFDFWQLCEELFGTDPVANCQNGQFANDIDEGNKRNMHLARMAGMLNCIDQFRHYPLPILEIGAGYGNFKDYVNQTTNYKYTGVDVYPKVRGVIKTTPEGFLPDELMKQKFAFIYSSNVFQHLSAKQRSRYFEDVNKVMNPDSIFTFSVMVHNYNPNDPNPTPESKISENNRRYLYHYGQMTEIPYYHELVKELIKNFEIMYETHRICDQFTSFMCKQKPVAKPVDNVPTP